MKRVKQLSCESAREAMDRYQDRQLDDTDMARMQRHIEGCGACRALLENRAALRVRVRAAVMQTEAPPDLAHRVQFAITKAGPPARLTLVSFSKPLMALAAGLLIAAGAFYFRPAEEAGPRREDQAQSIARFADQVAPVMRVGLRQHLHCGVWREYPATEPTPDELSHAAGISTALIDALETHAPEGLHVVMAHLCDYKGRNFTHVVARGDGHLMSLLITRRRDGEVMSADLKAAAEEAGTEIFSSEAASGREAYVMNAFETGDWLVYLVSDVTPRQNLKTLLAMTPAVRAALL